MDSITNYRKILVVMCILVAQFSMSGQMPIGIQNYDVTTFKRTIKKVHEIWGSNEHSSELKVDTILCAFALQFDTLDFTKIGMDESLLRKNMSLSINQKGFYDCKCQVYDAKGENVASFSESNDYIVFLKSTYKFWITEPYRERLLDHGDMIFIPQSKVHTFNFSWRAIITKDGNLRWLHLDDPDQTYSSAEIYNEHWEHFILGK